MSTEQEIEMARIVAPEDIRPGDYLTALHVICEHVPLPWERDGSWDGRPIRVLRMPRQRRTPVQVIDVCLPFALVRTPRDRHWLLDVRRYRLARLADSFGQRAFAQLQADRRAAGTPAADPPPADTAR